jgi:serine/threonine protein kinase
MLTGRQLDRYTLGTRIGSGGIGEVYEATDPQGQPVAIKVLKPEYAEDPDFKARFQRETHLMASLAHPHIIPVHDAGECEGCLYLVMQRLYGHTLDVELRRNPFTPANAWRYIKPLGNALDYGHSQGIAHRDVKPGNVFLTPDVYLMDFGLGKQVGVDFTLTGSDVAIGTPEYMSPEAALGEDIDYRTDIYSLAILMYELLLGTPPFTFPDPYRIAQAQVSDRIPTMSEKNPGFPQELEAVVMRSLSKNREERHQSVWALTEAFYEALCQLPPDAQLECFWPR